MNPSAPRFSLPNSRRLKTGRDFSRVRSAGQRLASGCLIMNWLPLPPRTPARLGIVTSRKVGGAVARSRSRRLLREVYRRHQHDLTQPADLVLVARPSIAGKSFAQVEKDFLGALRHARLRT